MNLVNSKFSAKSLLKVVFTIFLFAVIAYVIYIKQISNKKDEKYNMGAPTLEKQKIADNWKIPQWQSGRVYEKNAHILLDLSLSGDKIIESIGKTELPVITFIRGVKISLNKKSITFNKNEQLDGKVGKIFKSDKGLFKIKLKDGVLYINEACFEGDYGVWYQPDNHEAFLSVFNFDNKYKKYNFITRKRYYSYDSVIFWHTARILFKGDSYENIVIDIQANYYNKLMLDNKEWLFKLFAKVGLKPGDKFLDIGCGGGWASLLAKEYGLEVWGFDLFDAKPSSWINYVKGDITNLPKFPVKFDFIFIRGLTPLAFTPSLSFSELINFRDKLLESLGDKGSIYLNIMGDGSGERKALDSWGNVTMAELYEWIGKYFANAAYGKTTYFCLLGTKAAKFSNKFNYDFLLKDSKIDYKKYWDNLINTNQLSTFDKYRILFKSLQVIWQPPHFNNTKIFLLGNKDEISKDLANLITYSNGISLIGFDKNLPNNLPSDATVIISPSLDIDKNGVAHNGKIFKITYDKLVLLYGNRDFYTLSGDQDTVHFQDFIRHKSINIGGMFYN